MISNFTWDWIYEDYREHLPAAQQLLPTIRTAYATATEAWRLPMHGGFEPFDVVRDLPFVARHATHTAEHTRALLGLPATGRLALSSFGGYGIDGFDPSRLDCLDAFGPAKLMQFRWLRNLILGAGRNANGRAACLPRRVRRPADVKQRASDLRPRGWRAERRSP